MALSNNSINTFNNNAMAGIYRSINSAYSSFVPKTRAQSLFQLSGYGVNLASGGKQSVVEIKEFANQLKDAANQLVAGYPPLMEQMVAAMEDSKALDVTSVDSSRQKTNQTLAINVTQTASAQRNTGAALSGHLDAAPGQYSIAVNQGNKTNTLTIDVTTDDDAKSIQSKLANAVNQANLGISARVDSENGASRLIFEGKTTGERSAFTISDVQGNLASALQLNNTDIQAQDAIFSVNGKETRSATNQVSLIKGVEATLTAATDKTETIRLQKDAAAIAPAVNHMIDSFNSLLKTARDNSSAGATLLTGQLESAFGGAASALSKAGITADENGYLQIDNNRLTQAIQDGSIQKALGNGFGSRIGRLAEAAVRNPATFAGVEPPTSNALTYAPETPWGNAYTPRTQNLGLLFESLI